VPVVTRQEESPLRRWFIAGGRTLTYLTLILITIVLGFPIYWMFTTALKTESQANTYPPALFPDPVMFSNFAEVLSRANFGRYLLNSTIVSLTSAAFVVFFGALAGYTFARLRFPGRSVLFAIVMSTIVIPGQVTMIPVFIIMARFPLLGGNDIMGQGGSGMLNTYPALIIPHIAGAFAIFMMRQFMSSLPEELSDAARIDGASEFGIFWRVMLPLTTPALITLGLFTFSNTWNDFIWPLITTNSDAMRTVQLGLSIFRGINYTQQTLFMAGTSLAMIPVMVLFLIGQRYFIRGIALSGIKG
jgi:multiple sugar transport system permease protein